MKKIPSPSWLLPYRCCLPSIQRTAYQNHVSRLAIAVVFLVKLLCVTSTLIMLDSCSRPEHLPPNELHEFIADEDNGLAKTLSLNDYSVMAAYRPTDLLVEQELDGMPASNAAIDSLRNKYSRYHYFILSLSANGKEALHQLALGSTYGDLVQTLSFRMANYVNLTTSAADTIPVGDFMLNRTYGLSKSTDLLFVFNRDKTRGTEWVQFNLSEFGLGIGDQKFRFRTKDLEEAPQIDFPKR